jgi:microcin C transport system substrate-binding protein
MRTYRPAAAATIAATLFLVAGLPAGAEPQHGLSTFGELGYPAGFAHFAYVDPGAPRGGEIRLHDVGSFDNLNPFIVKGIKLRGVGAAALADLPYDSLMERAWDEPDALYGLVARSAEMADDRSWVEFTLRPEARFHDGSPLTARDVVFSFEILKEKGAPQYRLLLRDVATASAPVPDKVRFTFREGARKRDLPLTVASLPIFSETYFREREFDRTTLEPPLGSGPYRITDVDQGRSFVYRRVTDYWAGDLPVNRGRFNFDSIRFDFYRDRNVAMEAFKAGQYDFREEFTSKMWATAYDFPAVADGLVVREALPDEAPASRQYFVLNLRRSLFRDRRVRQAFDLAFDFEWTNRNIFYGLYARTESLFQNTPMAARTLPTPEELALLSPHRDVVPPEAFTDVYRLPTTDGDGNNRANLRAAQGLLRDAGYNVRDGRLTAPSGIPVEIEILTFSPTFERVYAPLVRNLDRLGIRATIRIVDTAQYANRMQEYDFDVTTAAFAGPTTPGIEERNFWGSESGAAPGGLNYAGIADPAVDDLIEMIAEATDRASLETAARALDRVLLWNRYVIPQWFNATHNVAYWNIFARPVAAPKYDSYFGFLDTWWIDARKAGALDSRRASGN